MYRVLLTASAVSVLQKLHPEIRKAARDTLRELARHPFSGKELQAELRGFRSYRFRRYRIIFRVHPDRKELVVWAIGHRRDIYETFGQYLVAEQ